MDIQCNSWTVLDVEPQILMVGGDFDDDGGDGDGTELEQEGEVAVEDLEAEDPPRFAVILHNDDYTTMEFVIEVLQRFFKKDHDEAMQVMLKVHHEGRGVAGIFSFEIAETKAHQVTQLARSRGYPLKCTTEPIGSND